MKFLLQPQVLDEGKYNADAMGNAFPTEQDRVPERRLPGINLAALAYAASDVLGKCSVPTIKYLCSGGWNSILLLTYPDSSEVIARVARPRFRVPGKLASVAATMTFARYIMKIPCPAVYAWNDSDRTIIGAPYILMEKAHGVLPWKVKNWTYDEETQLRVLDSISEIHAKLAQPLTFSSSIGSIYFNVNPLFNGAGGPNDVDYSSPSLYQLGPFARSASRGIDSLNINNTSRPHRSLKAFWDEFVYAELSASLQRWPQGPDTDITPQPKEIEDLLLSERHSTLGDMLEAGKNLRAIASSCTLPEDRDLMVPCLVLADLAFRNFLIDPETLEVSAVLDWDDFSVMPFILCTRVPEDICFSSHASKAWIEESGNFFWFLPCEEPPPPDLPKEDGQEITFHAQRRFYKERLGTYDERFSREGLWAVREEPLKIQYLVTHGWTHWLRYDDWLKRRFDCLGNHGRLAEDRLVLYSAPYQTPGCLRPPIQTVSTINLY